MLDLIPTHYFYNHVTVRRDGVYHCSSDTPEPFPETLINHSVETYVGPGRSGLRPSSCAIQESATVHASARTIAPARRSISRRRADLTASRVSDAGPVGEKGNVGRLFDR